MKLNLQVFPL